jgi:hypothetical protein
MKRVLFAVLTGALTLGSIPGHAHHSGTMFDREQVVTYTGVVTEFQYTNPHSWLIVDIENEDGSVTSWGFEAEGPSTLIRGGIRKSDLSPGTKVTITAHPMKDGRPAAYWLKTVRLEDGKEFHSAAGFEAK